MTEAWTPSPHELERRSLRRSQRVRRTLTAVGVTVAVLGAALVGVVASPGWPSVHELFFNGHHAHDSFHEILKGFWINVKLFLICEPCILVAGLAIALARNARSPWLAPLRVVAVVYTDVVRGIPTILLVVLFGFGFPALRLQASPTASSSGPRLR